MAVQDPGPRPVLDAPPARRRRARRTRSRRPRRPPRSRRAPPRRARRTSRLAVPAAGVGPVSSGRSAPQVPARAVVAGDPRVLGGVALDLAGDEAGRARRAARGSSRRAGSAAGSCRSRRTAATRSPPPRRRCCARSRRRRSAAPGRPRSRRRTATTPAAELSATIRSSPSPTSSPASPARIGSASRRAPANGTMTLTGGRSGSGIRGSIPPTLIEGGDAIAVATTRGRAPFPRRLRREGDPEAGRRRRDRRLPR